MRSPSAPRTGPSVARGVGGKAPWFSRLALRAGAAAPGRPGHEAYWAVAVDELLERLATRREGLAQAEAARRLEAAGGGLAVDEGPSRWRALRGQLGNPLLLILVFAAIASGVSGQWGDAGVVSAIVCATVVVTHVREFAAETAIRALRAQVRVSVTALRDGRPARVPAGEIVPGDIVVLAAGSMIPGDGVVLESNNCFVNESVLTGESFPVEKQPGTAAADARMTGRPNSVFLGTSVSSGTATCLIVRTGRDTELGRVAASLARRRPQTDFERGVKRFGYLLTAAMLVLVVLVFAAHMLRGRPPVETLLFSVALAVGLSPELLPAILSVNLARGAQRMAAQGVIVRHLDAIENLGGMDVLCTDKTGTLTEGVVQVGGAYDAGGVPRRDVLTLAAINARFQTGLPSPLDEAILAAETPECGHLAKTAEVPFDFARKRVSVAVDDGRAARVIAKGAVAPLLSACTRTAGDRPLDAAERARLDALHEGWARQGLRVIAVATRALAPGSAGGAELERDLTLEGFLTFVDRAKADVAETIVDLGRLGVAVKVITGDSRLAARYVAAEVGLPADCVLTGDELRAMSDGDLHDAVWQAGLFAEVDPGQKERIIMALKRRGHVVGFLGDGVNDAPAMHAADVSLSVQTAVDVAREAADVVLLERSLAVIRMGIDEGRKTFANTLKYLLITISANLGNMISMAAASLFLPFLPLLAGQILLNNFLSDVPALGLADDNVDPERIQRPERWNVRWIGQFMLAFGLVSSLFDGIAFLTLLAVFHAAPALFRTAWFVESLLTELLVMLVLRTERPALRSSPGRLLVASTVALIAVTPVLPYLPGSGWFGFVPLPVPVMLAMCGIVLLYVAATEIEKRLFFRAVAARRGG